MLSSGPLGVWIERYQIPGLNIQTNYEVSWLTVAGLHFHVFNRLHKENWLQRLRTTGSRWVLYKNEPWLTSIFRSFLYDCIAYWVNCLGCASSDSHVLHSDILENLAVVNIPDRLVVPDLRGQKDCSQHDTLPVGRANVNLSIGK